MVKLGFRKRAKKVLGALFELIGIYITMLITWSLSGYLFLGFIGIIDNDLFNGSTDFARYLATISFTLAGFTFLASALIKNKNQNVTLTEIDIIHISYIFILSGFFSLVFIGLAYLPQTTILGKPIVYYELIKKIIFPLTMIFSIGFFLGALNYLIFLLRVKLPRLSKKHKKEFKKKTPLKKFIKEITGFD